MRLAVATVNYCCADVLVPNLKATADQIADAGGVWYIVDNCSPDNSIAKLRSALQGVEEVELIEAERNGGFGYGNNRVIERVSDGRIEADYVYFLNPDAFPEPGAIQSLVAYLENNPEVGIVGSALTNPDGSHTASMFRFPSVWGEIESALEFGPASRLLGHFKQTLPRLTVPAPVDWVAGTSFLMRADLLRLIGGFDEDFFLYWEEVELCYRVRKAGFEIHGLPDAKVRHIGGVSTGMHRGNRRIPPYWHQSRNLYFQKTGSAGSILMLNTITALCLAARRCWESLRGKPYINPHFLRDHIKHALNFQFERKKRVSDGSR